MSSRSSRSSSSCSSSISEDDRQTGKELVMTSFAENTPQLPTSISKRSFMDDVYLEDGPLFRATIKQLEDRTAALKTSLKRIIKSAAASLEVRRQLTRADEAYFEALRETQCIEPLMSHYLTQAWQTIQQERNQLDESLSSHLLDPLKRCYEEDVKVAELKRRQFEEESKEYYASLAKFLKTKKHESMQELQKKQNQKKCKFDLARFDYLGFLLELHGGKKENEILFCIADNTIRDINYFETISTKIQVEKPGLNELMTIMIENSSEQEVLASERANKRKELVTMCNINNDMVVDQDQKQLSKDLFKGIRDLEPTRDQLLMMGRKKEGFLFATSKPSKSSGFDVTSSSVTWHKYWCVLSGGKLHEYSNWKRHLEAHIEPINLRFATVREARNAERRFCFEVITPQLRRIYQATSQEEASSWIGTIHNSIESVLKGTASSANLFELTASRSATLRRHGRSLSGAFKSGFAAVTGNSTSSSAPNGVIPSPSQSTSAIKSRKRQSTFDSTASSTPIASNASLPVSGHIQTPSEGAELLVSASTSPNERFRWSGFSFGSLHDKNNNANKQQSQQQPQAPLSTIQQSTNNAGNYVFSSLPDSESNTRLLAILREDPSNYYCVDCGAKDPDWCSLNLGVLLCIECSGIHRSLGTHISKIRSLTLDSTSYTPDIIELLKSVGNARSNVIWDDTSKKEDLARPNPTDSRSVKLAYIQAKYVGKTFVKKQTLEDEQDVDQILFEAIDDDDIPRALYALALGANVNSSRPNYTKSPRISLFIDPQQQQRSSIQSYVPFSMNLDDDESSKKYQMTNDTETKKEKEEKEDYIVRFALHYALLHGREASDDELFSSMPLVICSSSSTTTNNTDGSSILSSSSELSGSKRKFIFPMAELLLQNGADTGIVDPKTRHTLADLVGMGSVVNDDAIAYINLKNTARGQSTITRSSTILNHHLLNLHMQQLEEDNDTKTEQDIPPPLPPKNNYLGSIAQDTAI